MATVTSQTELRLVVDTVAHISTTDSTSQTQFSSLPTIVARRIKESFTNVLTKFHAGYFRMVKEEFLHHVGVNYLFAPSVSWLLLLQSAPFFCFNNPYSYAVLWWVFVVPVVVLDVKIYGQWFTKGKKFLSAVANPTSHLSVIGNLVAAQAAANMGWKESAICFFSLGIVHYLVLFVTLYQRLSGTDQLPTRLRPAFFLYFAAPSMASLAWQSRYRFKDAILSLALPLRFTGLQAGTV
ncbi:hypothetical protein GQ457_07G026790 [Hibiscus cannabinus]